MSMLRDFMSHKVRSNAGCWTCRLRRKKCDERRPVCDGCRTLEITCHFDDEKPDWMDGGPKQKLMADKIKMQVKKQASQRRDRKYMDILRSGTAGVDMDIGGGGGSSEDASPDRGHGIGHELQAVPDANLSRLEKHITPPSSYTSSTSPDENPQQSSQFFDHYQQTQQTQLPPPLPSPLLQQKLTQQPVRQVRDGLDSDVHFVMIYLDYVFPYLFPHYRPPVLAGGRGWVLDKLQSSKTVYHTALSLASYFFGVMLAESDAGHVKCVARMGEVLQEQVEKGLRELQREMRAVNAQGDNFRITDGLLVMQSITQMVVFELATTNKETWKVHLEAAFAMFTKILPEPQKWVETLEGLCSSRWPPQSMAIPRPWSTDQAALRFYTANLMLMDVMSSITLERAPRLKRYHDTIIPGVYNKESRTNTQTAGPIFMDDFSGLHNWVVHVIGDVATLDAWKKDETAAGTFCQDVFLCRAQTLLDSINTNLPCLEQQADYEKAKNSVANIVEDPFPALDPVATENREGFHPVMAAYNALWLRATLVYLYTVIHGWQPEHPEIKMHVSIIICTICTVPRSSCLRGLVWPFFVAGCLAPVEEEEKLRVASRRLGPLQVFGLIKEASDIMEKVWSRRDNIDESWNIAKCLRILGHRSLLT